MKKFFIGLAVVVVIGLGLFVFLKPTAKVATVVSGKATNAVSGNVTVQAEYQMDLKSEISGRLIKSELDPGKKVEAGAILAQLDTGDLQLEIEKIETDYEAAKKRIAVGSMYKLDLETARQDLDNYERLTKTGNYAPGDLEKQRRLVKQIEQRVAVEEVAQKQEIANLENTLKVKKRQLEKMTITAPFEGVVSAVYLRPGDLINSNAAIATLITTSRAVEAKISQEDFASVKLNQPALVRFTGHEGNNYDATVSKILPTAEADTQRYPILLEVKCPPELLVPGLTGEVSVIVGTRDAKAIIPRRALFGNNVYVIVDGRIRLRKVEVGYVALNKAEILKGLSPGDLIVVEDLDKYRDGDRVNTETVTQ